MRETDLDENLRKLQEGDALQLDVIYRETHKQVFASAVALLRDRALAEDAMQETYVRLLQSAGNYRPGSNPFAYIMTICRNVCLNVIRKRARETEVDVSKSEPLFGSELTHSPLEQLENVEGMLRGLSDDERETIMYRVYAGLKHRETAVIMKKPLGTVLWLYSRAVKKVKENIAAMDEDERETE